MQILRPSSLLEACHLLESDPWDTRPLAGGTALVLMLRQGLVAPRAVVRLDGVDGLDGLEVTPHGLRIGALTTLTDVAASPVVQAHAPSLAYACSRVGNLRVRNAATLGGNVAEADYASDPPSVLVSLDAWCQVAGPSGGTRDVPVRELITGFLTTTLEPGEVVQAVVVPLDPGGRRATYEKYISRSSEDRPCVGVAASVQLRDGAVRGLTVVVGAVAGTPQRFDDLTAQAVGTTLGPSVRRSVASAYASAVDAMDDARGSAWYRQQMTEVVVRRALERIAPVAAGGGA
ncbi:MAG TPA: FAD binding domain-containing protein [Actinomycetales bacterium]|nr:FAD binding domain-containing protein [Actinomycetales bacterium]